MDDDFDVFQTMTTTPRTFPQVEELRDVENNVVNVESLASSHHLMLITLKSITCPVCPQLLKVLNMYGLDPDTNTFIDPFTQQKFEIDQVRKRFFTLLLKQDAYFIILCPGTNQQVRHIQETTPFLDYPFIAGQQAMDLAKALKVQLSEQEIMPAILEVISKDTSPSSLSVVPVYIGRGPGHYFHHFLLKRLIEDRCKMEMKGIICLRYINELINQLKRRIIKCQDGKLTSAGTATIGLLQISSPPSVVVTPLNNTFISLPPTSPLPCVAAAAAATNEEEKEEQQQIHYRNTSLNDLPLELLEIIFACFSNDVPSLIKVAGTCRTFYVAVCNVMILCLRNQQMTYLKPALPHLPQQGGEGNVQLLLWDEAQVADQSLDRWSSSGETQQGIPYRELQERVSNTNQLISSINHWTNHWNPIRNRTRRSLNL